MKNVVKFVGDEQERVDRLESVLDQLRCLVTEVSGMYEDAIADIETASEGVEDDA